MTVISGTRRSGSRRGLSFGGVKFCDSPGFKPGEAEPGRGGRGAVRERRRGRREEMKRTRQSEKAIPSSLAVLTGSSPLLSVSLFKWTRGLPREEEMGNNGAINTFTVVIIAVICKTPLDPSAHLRERLDGEVLGGRGRAPPCSTSRAVKSVPLLHTYYYFWSKPEIFQK